MQMIRVMKSYERGCVLTFDTTPFSLYLNLLISGLTQNLVRVEIWKIRKMQPAIEEVKGGRATSFEKYDSAGG